MTNKYKNVTYKMFLRIILASLIAGIIFMIILYVFIDGILQDRAANMLVEMGLYQFFKGYKNELLFSGFIIILLVSLYFVISKFSRYFEDISSSVDNVFNESEGEIILPGELKAMENQLNSIKNTLKHREFQARESEQRKNDLVVYLAHDLKTPLTSVIGYLNLLRDEQQISPELREHYLSITLEKAEKLEDLINEFFDITRFSLQSSAIERNRLNITLMLEQLTDEFYPLFTEKNITCRTYLEQQLLYLGDGDKLARVFDNLLRNAVIYSYEQSIIEIAARRNEAGINIIFRNQGDQIPELKLDKIFNKFYRLDSSRSSRTGGAGLGLAIAREIVEMHGGSISASSNEQFTEFRIWLQNKS